MMELQATPIPAEEKLATMTADRDAVEDVWEELFRLIERAIEAHAPQT